jgi:RimJ/RimL family protein N-acetyltransferase
VAGDPAIRLEPLGREHVDVVARLVEDAAVQRFTRVPVPIPDGFAETWIERYEAGRRDGTREGFAVVDDDGAFLGLGLAADIDLPARTVELGYVVAPEARGRGVAQALLRELTAWAFAVLRAERIELRISVANPASKRVAARGGYQLEGVLRSVHLKPGVREDVEVWSRLPDDG